MQTFFEPNGIVIVGVSDSPTNLGRSILANLLAWKFPGKICAVGRRGGTVGGITIETGIGPEVSDCDLAVVITPAPVVPETMRRLGAAGIRHVVIESAGFDELGAEGGRLQREVAAAAEAHDMRFIGPNGIGVFDLVSRAVVPFALVPPDTPVGGLAVLSQSGGVGLTAVRALAERQVGCRWMASLGNKVDVDEVDLLSHLLAQPSLRQAFLYLESTARGQELCDLIRASPAPVVVQKANRTAMTHAAAQSHTAALANDDRVVDACLAQAGAIRVSESRDVPPTIDALRLPPLRGERIALLSRSGGHGVLAADACEQHRLELPSFSAALLAEIDAVQPAGTIQRGNPLDFGDIYDFERIERILTLVAQDQEVDGVLLIIVHSFTQADPIEWLLESAAKLSRAADKPIAVSVVSSAAELLALRRSVDWPIFEAPEEAVAALGTLLRRHRARASIAGERITGSIEARLPEPRGKVLGVGRSLELMAEIGIPVVQTLPVAEVHHLPFPIAAKIDADSEEVIHKAAAGMLELEIRERDSLPGIVADMEQRAPGCRVIAQPMLRGPELFIGAARDPSFGPILLVGSGGSLLEVVDDVQVLAYPFTRQQLAQTLAATRLAQLLGEQLDIDQLSAWLANLGELVSQPAVLEIDVNPILFSADGPFAVDARILCA